MRRHLENLRDMRGREAHGHEPPRLVDVKSWQAVRLARTYADLLVDPRYAKATAFFLGDLYGAKDFSGRDEAMRRIYPIMVRTLPRGAVETAALAIEVDALSEDLDRRMAAAIDPGPVTEASYARAYRRVGARAERVRQIELIDNVGRRLDKLVVMPFLFATLKVMRGPAKLLGLEELQTFLERGFVAFRHMGGAEHFLATISGRESEILNRLFSGHPNPISG
ncbi:MAG: hypothetical protein IPP91_02425 [Betaproteobacteria bacterium]|nr:hypothetical protein [Betaproteobacteria bacterium]